MSVSRFLFDTGSAVIQALHVRSSFEQCPNDRKNCSKHRYLKVSHRVIAFRD
jgi:hypothetical protein